MLRAGGDSLRDRTKDYRFKSVGNLLAASLLEYLFQGGTDEKDIRELADKDLKYIHERKDCADFRVAYFVRVLFSFEDSLPAPVREDIVNELLSFPYEDCGGHGMCTWTENHRLYAGGSEYLLAQKYRDRIFGDGKNASYHFEHAAAFLRGWIEHSEKYGLCEWESNNYYSETMAGLANVIQFVGDKDIAEGAKRVFTAMLFDIFSQTAFNGGYMYNPACARAYADNKTGSKYGNYEEVVLRAILGEEIRQFKDKEGCVILMLKAKDDEGNPIYTVPPKLFELLHREVKETAMVQGVNIADYEREGLKKYSPEAVRYAFEGGAFSDYRVINNTMRYMRESGLIDNDMLSNLKPFASPLLVKTGLLKLIKRFKPVSFDGAAMEEGRVYTYVNRNYSISAAFDYRVGEISYQQNSLAVNLSHEISLFANTPVKGMLKAGSPGYWIGSGTTPRAAAQRNIGAEIFDVKHAKIGRAESHLFFPTGLFDEVDLSGFSEGILLGYTRGVNVCVRTNPGVSFVSAEESLSKDHAMYQDEKLPAGYYNKPYDLINRTEGYHFYLFEADNTMPFEAFAKKMKIKKLDFNAKTSDLNYGDGAFCLSYKGVFTADGRKIKPEFKRPAELAREYQ